MLDAPDWRMCTHTQPAVNMHDFTSNPALVPEQHPTDATVFACRRRYDRIGGEDADVERSDRYGRAVRISKLH